MPNGANKTRTLSFFTTQFRLKISSFRPGFYLNFQQENDSETSFKNKKLH
ncbi:hypothetical protein RC62_3363 [Flavobacterium aquidurense]|uniref:Uncharacterized protein n=1 Tax=Flavobacterium aquidurense TaxID=362413 RepID=A0A0Q0SDL7_9FLAO|nr:hypothetical protein RC62_3363 [Flavobacterium aquidurense]